MISTGRIVRRSTLANADVELAAVGEVGALVVTGITVDVDDRVLVVELDARPGEYVVVGVLP
jgi:hypothetical protein